MHRTAHGAEIKAGSVGCDAGPWCLLRAWGQIRASQPMQEFLLGVSLVGRGGSFWVPYLNFGNLVSQTPQHCVMLGPVCYATPLSNQSCLHALSLRRAIRQTALETSSRKQLRLTQPTLDLLEGTRGLRITGKAENVPEPRKVNLVWVSTCSMVG